MKTIRAQKRITITAILLSLLFHAVIMLYILWRKTNIQNDISVHEQHEALQEKINKDEGWAETKARAGDFGTPIFFEPYFAEAPKGTSAIEANVDTEKKEAIEQEESKEVSHEEKKPQKVVTTEPTELQKPIMKRSRRTRPIREQQQTIEPQKTMPTPATPPKQPSSPTKQLPTLAQLADGFLHSRENGQHAVSMLGNRKGLPTDEQIKYERYLQKLSWCLQNSFTINRDRYPISYPIDLDVHIFFALNKDGTLKQLTLAKSSKNIQLDQFALFVLRDASSSFPPVPQYLPHDPFSITYIINFNTTQESNVRIYRR